MSEKKSKRSDFLDSTILCSRCGWFGLGSEADYEYYEEWIDYTCPSCDKPLAVFSAYDAFGDSH